jgi:hypothetical protein
MDGRQPLIARTDRAIALSLQRIEEALQCIGRQVAHQEPIYRSLLLSGGERQKQGKCIPVALLRITRQIAFAYQMFE